MYLSRRDLCTSIHIPPARRDQSRLRSVSESEKRQAHYASRFPGITVIVTTMAAYAVTTFGIDEIGPALEVDGKKERSV